MCAFMIPDFPSPSPPKRPPFTAEQLLQAEKAGYISDAHRAKRAQVTTQPIDAPSIPDPDDGIFIEVKRSGRRPGEIKNEGGYRVNITIADVAAHVPPGSPLAELAATRVRTHYFPGGHDPLYPKDLEYRMGLFDGLDRLGITIVLDFDAQFQPVHMEFQPVIANSQQFTYSEASQRAKTNKQLALMQMVADGIQGTLSPTERQMLQKLQHQEIKPNATDTQRDYTKVVQTYMLKVNAAAADFFAKTNIDFPYRNFNAQNTHAHYSTEPTARSDMQEKGQKVIYSHITSPIRRGPDLYAQHQMHFVIESIDAIVQGLVACNPNLDREQTAYYVWDHPFALLNAMVENSASTQHIEARFLDLLRNVEKDQSIALVPPSPAAVKQSVMDLAARIPPYRKGDLAEPLAAINAILHREERPLRQGQKHADRFRGAILDLEQLRDEQVPGLSAERLLYLLHGAALTGILPEALFRELQTRFENPASPERRQLGRYAYEIMLLATYPSDARWRELKKTVARILKQEPSVVNSVLDMASAPNGIFAEADLVFSEKNLLGANMRGGNPLIRASLLTLATHKEGQTLATPYYSIGHNMRAAQSHAKYSFVEHYAFGQLQPVEQVTVPHMLYAELEKPERERKELIARMAEDIGATMREEVLPASAAHRAQVRVTISGGKLTDSIIARGEANTLADAQKRAYRKLLRQPAFKHAVSAMDIQATLRNVYPFLALRQRLQELKMKYEIKNENQGTGSRPHFVTSLKFGSDDKEMPEFKGEGPNIDRAANAAADAALSYLDARFPEKAPKAGYGLVGGESWVRQVSARSPRPGSLSV